MTVFPLSMSGDLAIPEAQASAASAEAMLDRVEAMLQEAGATCAARAGASVAFTVKMFRWVNRDNVLTMIDAGQIDVEDKGHGFAVRYVARTKRFAISAIVAITATVGAIAAALVGGFVPRPAQAAPWLLLPVAMLLVYAANFFFARFRFRRWLRAGLAKADRGLES